MSSAEKNEFKILADKYNSNKKNVCVTQLHKQNNYLQIEASIRTSDFYNMKNHLTDFFNSISENRKYNLTCEE